jgi:putative ABC transport system substrate-binding protein
VIRSSYRRTLAIRLFALAANLAIALPLQSAYSQQPALPRHIGLLLAARSPDDAEMQAFNEGLREAGYTIGRDLVIEARFTNGDYARVAELITQLIKHKIEVLVVDSTPATQAAKRATSTIPIVMTSIADPVGSGLVESLAHPGGNVTGLSIMATDLSAKRLQLLKELIPQLSRVAVLWNLNVAYAPGVIRGIKAVAPALSIEPVIVGIRTPEDFGPAFSAFARAHAQALYVMEDSFLLIHRATVLRLASKARLPAIFPQRQVVREGGLISYGPSYADLFRRTAGYVDKILKGAKPSELPVEQPTSFELSVNLQTAASLGIAIPESVVLRADEVIR